MARVHHIRTRLALTYAAIALLTAGLLGTILVGVLATYYGRAERAFLQAAAQRVLQGNVPDRAAEAKQWAFREGIVSQVRIRLYGSGGELVADSGSPREIDPGRIDQLPGVRDGGPRERLPRPLGEGIFGRPQPRPMGEVGGAALRVDVPGGDGAYVLVSEPPVSGADVLSGIIQAWALAAGLAVALAALAGYLLSSRLSRPVIELTAASDRMAEGDLTARAAVNRDDEYGRLAESFNTMAARIETTVVSLRRFVADAAHEIGTPLTALEADLELAQNAATTPDEQRLVTRAMGQARRLESLTQGLLRLSRIESGDTPDLLEAVDAGALVREIADAAASRAEQADVALEVRVAGEPLSVRADRAKLTVVFENLLDNALKFTPAGGRVVVDVVREGGAVLVAVEDTGVGIPEAERAQVFERFHRARNVAAYPGSGLGLAIVAATVDRFGGTVRLDATALDGARFEVRLPLAG